jgi:murein tripeptide amidase MpaA
MRISTRVQIQFSILLAILVLADPPPGLSQPAVRGPAGLQTAAEASGFSEYTSYSEMMDYLQAVQASSTEMRLAIYGTSYEGRELPIAIFSRPSIRRPWEALVSGKPIVLLAANVHGGERTLRESALILIREFATPGTGMNRLLDDLVVLVVPSINPDGLMVSPRATRGNAWGIDLNRDYVKLEQQALFCYVTNVVNTWQR